MARLNLTAPWVEHYNKLKAFFEKDRYVTVVIDEEDVVADGIHKIKMVCSDPERGKGYALDQVLRKDLPYTTVEVLYRDKDPEIDAVRFKTVMSDGYLEQLSFVLRGNEALEGVRVKYLPGISPEEGFKYVIFKKEVVQYYADDLSDYYGHHSTLYEILARDIFETPPPGVFFCTERVDNKESQGCVVTNPWTITTNKATITTKNNDF